MNTLIEQLKITNALIKPATQQQIEQAEHQLNIQFSLEYRLYLEEFGVISLGSKEIYGLGVKDSSYLNLLTIVPDLRQYPGYPSQAVPLLEIGDGHYYLYDNYNQKILMWAIPNGGKPQEIEESLENFLIKQLSKQNS